MLLDGGIRRGTDVVKALALGAHAVAIGRPALWGLAVDGETGVGQVLEMLRAELAHALMLCGCASLRDVGRELVRANRIGDGNVLTLLSLAAAVLVAASLPRWLPAAVIALRMRIFARVNGEEAIALPGASADAARFKRVYAHPAANGRSRGAALSDLFWYWLSPGPEIHQEHLEPGERYDEVAATTRRILALPRRAAEELAAALRRARVRRRAGRAREARAAARLGDADMGRVLLRAGVRRDVPDRRAPPHRGQRERRRHGAQVLRAAAHEEARPADAVPDRADRGRRAAVTTSRRD